MPQKVKPKSFTALCQFIREYMIPENCTNETLVQEIKESLVNAIIQDMGGNNWMYRYAGYIVQYSQYPGFMDSSSSRFADRLIDECMDSHLPEKLEEVYHADD